MTDFPAMPIDHDAGTTDMDNATSASRAGLSLGTDQSDDASKPEVLDSPVFVDGSGRRRRWLLRTTYGLAAVAVLYMSGLVYSLAAGTVNPATTTLPGARALAPIAEALQPLVASAHIEPDTTGVSAQPGSARSRSAESQPGPSSSAASIGTVPAPPSTAAGSLPAGPGAVVPPTPSMTTATPAPRPTAASPAPTPIAPSPSPTAPPSPTPQPAPEPTAEPEPIATAPAEPAATAPAPPTSPVGPGP